MNDELNRPTAAAQTGDPDVTPQPEAVPPPAVEEFTWLMSLALDDLLDGEDRQRFDDFLVRYPTLADTWTDWQTLDRRLMAVPSLEPAAGFTQRFEQRLGQKERRQRWLLAGALGVALVLASVAVLSGALGVGALVLLTQGPWIGEQIHNLAFVSVTASNWFGSLAGATGALVNTSQARWIGLMYLFSALLAIVVWAQFLRRSARLSDVISTVGME